MSLRDVLQAVPYRLRNRFASLGSYIEACIQQSIEEPQRANRSTARQRAWHSEEDRQVIQMAVFTVAVGRFFQDGTRAASLATDAFASLGAGGFSVGSTQFEGRNQNVMMGQQLRAGLSNAVGNEERLFAE